MMPAARRARVLGRDGRQRERIPTVKITIIEIRRRCEETLEQLACVHGAAPADVRRMETRVRLAMQCWQTVADTRPDTSEAWRFGRRVIEAQLSDAAAFIEQAEPVTALAAA